MPDDRQWLARARRILRSHDEAAASVGGVPAAPFDGGEFFEGTLSDVESVANADPMAAAAAAERQASVRAGLDAMRKLDQGRDDQITRQEQIGLEAIILLTGRPAILVQNDDFLEPPKAWANLKKVRPRIQDVLKRVGRINVSGSPSLQWLGTGFLAGPASVITNQHVAAAFARCSDTKGWQFRKDMGANIDLRAELGTDEPLVFQVTGIVGIHDNLDLAVLQVEQTSGAEALPSPLPVCSAEPKDLQNRPVYVVGYPAWDGRRNDPQPMERIFSQIYNVKRLQPGEISGADLDKRELFHDCSTLGGNSGSPVIDLETHQILGLHFGGRFMENNRAVPLWMLRDDALIKKAGLNFQ